MNWLDKVRLLKDKFDLYGLIDLSLDVDFFKNCWQPGELEELVKKYPYLSKEYVEFIKEFDGCGIAWVTFYGSQNSPIISIREEIDYWQDKLKGNYFPFGKDADGSIYTFNKKGEVIYFDEYDYELEKPEKIASSFIKFVDDYLLGKRFKEFNNIEKSKFYDFLVAQGWA